jgi:hypothetical protein
MVSGAVIGSITGGFNAAIHGGNLGDVLQGAAIGGVQGALSGALHGFEPASFGFNSESALHVAGHGVVGGASNAAMGGKFQDGFISAAVSAAASNAGAFRRIQGNGAGEVASRTALAGVIGGTASALGGGKFANGAWTSAFQHLLNAELPSLNKNGANLVIFRTARDSTTSVWVYEGGEYLGGFVGNMDPDGSPDYAAKSGGGTHRGPPDGDYSLRAKSAADYEGGKREYVPGTPSITGKGRQIGSPAPGYLNTVRFHPYGGSTACQTGTLEWSNRIWDIVARNPAGTVHLRIVTSAYPKAIPVGPRLPAPQSHPWPAFTGHTNPIP